MFSIAAVLLCGQSTLLWAQSDHIVTAWRNHWIHKNQYSGVGTSNPVRIAATPGDIIEFRQSEGRHGLFFYSTQINGESDLGLRDSVDDLFSVVSSHAAHSMAATIDEADDDEDAVEEHKKASIHVRSPNILNELDKRIFPRTGRQTSLRSGRTTILTIRLSATFNRPLYFGDLGQNGKTGFGVIVPVKRDEIASIQETSVKRIDVANKSTTAWTLDQLCIEANGFRYDFDSKLKEFGSWTRASAKSGETEAAKLFDSESVQIWDPTSPEPGTPPPTTWKYAICEDFNSDGSSEVLVMGTRRGSDEMKWSVLQSNFSTYDRLVWVVTGGPSKVDGENLDPETESFQFENTFAAQVGEREYVGEPVDPPFAAPIDLDKDGYIDVVVLEHQGERRVLQPYFNRRAAEQADQSTEKREFHPAGKTAPLPGSLQPSYWSVIDDDYDGWPDLLLGNPGQLSGTPVLAINAGGLGGFRELLSQDPKQPQEEVVPLDSVDEPILESIKMSDSPFQLNRRIELQFKSNQQKSLHLER